VHLAQELEQLMLPPLLLSRRRRRHPRVWALDEADDGVDVGSEPREEHEPKRRRGTAPQQDVLHQENDLSGEYVLRL
jgi:hypothetical protein